MTSTEIGARIHGLLTTLNDEQATLRNARAKRRLSQARYEDYNRALLCNIQGQVQAYGRMLMDIEMGRKVT